MAWTTVVRGVPRVPRTLSIFAVAVCCTLLTASGSGPWRGTLRSSSGTVQEQVGDPCEECRRKEEGNCYREQFECEGKALDKVRPALEECDGIKDFRRCRSCRKLVRRGYTHYVTACSFAFRTCMGRAITTCYPACKQ